MTGTRISRWLRAAFILSVSLVVAPPFALVWCDDLHDRPFVRITTDMGLAHNSVYDMLQDQWGFLWFATEDGLSRYDGYAMVSFRHDPFDHKTLSESDINDIYDDGEGGLWVGSWGGGLDRLDQRTLEVTRFCGDGDRDSSLSDNRVLALFGADDGFLWIGTYRGGLNRFDPASGFFSHFPRSDVERGDNDDVFALDQDGDGRVWMGTDDGLCRFSDAEPHVRKLSGGPELGRVRTLRAARDGGFWLGTTAGVFRARSRGRGHGDLVVDPEALPSTGHLSCNSVLEDGEGRLWIGTGNHGLLCFDPESGKTIGFEHSRSDPTSLSHNDVRSLMIDRSDNLWIGTRGGGVNRLDLKPRKFPRALVGESDLSGTSVWAFEDDAEGNLWVGTSEGLFRISEEGARIDRFVHDPSDETSLSHQKVRAVLEDSAGRIWIGTNGGGLNLFDSVTGTFRRFVLQAEYEDLGPASNDVWALERASKGGLWVGTDGGGLDFFDPATERFRHFLPAPDNPGSLSHNHITAVLEDHGGDLWVGTAGGGLSLLPSDGSGFRTFRVQDGPGSGPSNNNVVCLHEAGDGSLWIGTHAGLNRFDRSTGTFDVWSSRDGLPSNFVYGILEDEDGVLWLTTNQGLARLDPRTGICRAYGVDDGLQATGFNEGAAHTASDGRMYVGGIRGFNHFLPAEVNDNPFEPRVLVTGMRVLNRERIFARPLWTLNEVELHPGDSTFTFEFTALEFTAPERNSYRYRMEGFDLEWVEVGTRRHATYTNLDPGRYRFQVQASNNDGVWSSEGASVGVRVIPAMWQTRWFLATLAIASLGLLLAVYRLRTRAIVRRNVELEGLVERRRRAEAEVRRYAEELEHSNLHDQLTGLPNRALLLDRLRVMMDRAVRRSETTFAVLVADLDGFKLVNDSLGHAIGDELLRAVSKRAESYLRSTDTLSRLGGDEFALLLGEIHDVTDLTHLLERMHRALDAPFLIQGHEIFTTVSIGVVNWNQKYSSPGEMLRDADTAMHRAKAEGRGNHVIFDPVMHHEATAALETEGALRKAVDREQFVLEFQPIVDIRSGGLGGFEALIRWKRPGHDLVYPGQFLSQARDAGLAEAIGQWVVQRACEQARRWEKLRPKGPVNISVNLFTEQVSNPGLVELVESARIDAGLAASRLHFEITEDVLIDAPGSAIEVLSELRSRGHTILLDDFGTGYSSLSYLQRFPVDGLKIDRSFIGGMIDCPDSMKIVQSILLLARSLGKEVVAEGVETRETHHRLKELGCPMAQGFLFGRSLNGEAADLLVRDVQLSSWGETDLA